MKRLLLPFLFLCTSFLLAQPRVSNLTSIKGEQSPHPVNEKGRPFIINYSPDEYQAHPQNWDVLQDDLGLIYIANGDAILQYDGVEWRKLELPSLNRICTLAKDSENRIFVGADKELGYIDFDARGYMRFVSLLDKIPEIHRDLSNVWFVFVLQELVLFISNKKIYLWDGKKMEVLVCDHQIQKAFLVGEDLYLNTQDVGLIKLVDKAFKEIPGGVFFKNTLVYSILPYDANTVLITSIKKGMYLYDGTLKAFPNEIEGYLKEFQVYKGLKIKDQYVYATLSGGLVVMNQKGEEDQIITTKEGLLDNQIYGMSMDNQAGLWVTTQNGISRIEWSRPYSIFDEYQGLGGWIFDIQRHQGKLYLANSFGLQVLTKEEHRHQFEQVDTLKNRIWDLVSVGKDLIVGAENGIFQLTEPKIVQQISSISTTLLYQSKVDSNRIFIGHPKGLSAIYYSQNKWIEEGHAVAVNQDVLSISETSSGDLWLGTRIEGVLRLKADKSGHWGQFNQPEFYLENQGIPAGWSRIYVINDEVRVRTDCQLTEQCFHSFQENENKFIPDPDFAKNYGAIQGYNLSIFQESGGHLLLKHLTKGESMYSAFQLENDDYQLNKIQLGGLDQRIANCAYWEQEQVLWLGGEALVRYDLTLVKETIPHFPVYVRKVTAANDSIIFAGLQNSLAPEFRSDENALRIEFAAPFFDLSEKNEYQYQLIGFDKGWSHWSPEHRKDYTNLPPGHYQFKVRARNLYQVISEEGSYEFTILAPWYLSWYAYLLYGAVTVFLIGAFIKLRSRQLLQEKEILEKLVAERTQEVSAQAQQLVQQAHQLQELDRLKSEFFANISHEFRTPLTLIKGPLDNLAQHPKEQLNPDNIKMIRRSANRMLRLVNQLLDLSKIDGGRLQLEPIKGDVYQCLRSAAASFNSHAAQRNIDYLVHIPSSLLWAFFDKDKLEKVIYNLLSNAFKFSDDRSTISFQAKYSNSRLQIEVKDLGKGIPKEKLPYIFDRFYQIDNSSTKEKEGSGIGLSLSKELADLMDGQLNVESELGKGSIFTLHLPIQEIKISPKELAEMHAQEEHILQNPEPFKLTKTDKRNLPEILLVEDNDDMRHYIRHQLLNGYRVKEAINGELGLQNAIDNPPDLIITDLMMPKMDGLELCKRLRTNINTSHIPIIMLTAKAGIDNKIEGLETGADDYLIKPFDAKELLVRTQNLIKQRKKLRELYSNKKIPLDPKKVTVTSMDQLFLEKVLALFEEKYTDADFGVPQMQEFLAMSKTQLHRKLKALTNEAPGELLRNFRLKRAAQLLSQKADSVSQIAYMVGFNNLSYFAKCYKELYGVTPSAYKK